MQYIETDFAVVVHVGMEDFGEEPHGRGFVGVVLGEFEEKTEGSSWRGRAEGR